MHRFFHHKFLVRFWQNLLVTFRNSKNRGYSPRFKWKFTLFTRNVNSSHGIWTWKNKLFLSEKATILAGLWAPPCGPVRRREGGNCEKKHHHIIITRKKTMQNWRRTVTRTLVRWLWMLPRPVVPALRSPSRPRKRRQSRATRNPGKNREKKEISKTTYIIVFCILSSVRYPAFPLLLEQQLALVKKYNTRRNLIVLHFFNCRKTIKELL